MTMTEATRSNSEVHLDPAWGSVCFLRMSTVHMSEGRSPIFGWSVRSSLPSISNHRAIIA